MILTRLNSSIFGGMEPNFQPYVKPSNFHQTKKKKKKTWFSLKVKEVETLNQVSKV